MTHIDYMMKSLWHGAHFPKEKRLKFTERWRSNLDVNSSGKPETKKPLLTEFIGAGKAIRFFVLLLFFFYSYLLSEFRGSNA